MRDDNVVENEVGRRPEWLEKLKVDFAEKVIPAGRFERRYAAFAVSATRRGQRGYFRALHDQIQNGGAEAMFYELRSMDLEGWHPREIPEALLTNSTLQKQQSYNLPPTEQWYVELLHCGRLPLPVDGKPHTSLTKDLIEDAISHVPRLRWELSDVALRNFLINQDAIGVVCTKYRCASNNGWTFPPLSECREVWSKLYGPTEWDTDMNDWGVDEPPKRRPKVAEPKADNVVAIKPGASWRRFR